MPKLKRLLVAALLVAAALLPVAPAAAQSSGDNAALPPAKIVNDEGGPQILNGDMNYTNPESFQATAEPLIVLEDQAGFVDRNHGFVLPLKSQVLGVITGDFYSPPFTWTLSLPIQPQGSLRDVDQNGKPDKGVMVYAVAYWSNIFGGPYLERRDMQGGGWSTAYASTRVNPNPSAEGEVTGGKYIVWAPDDQQGFPSDFGPDGKLFTKDDPIVRLPAGYTLVDMDTHPFTFDRSKSPFIDLIEPPLAALADYSKLSYTEAFDKMVDMFRKRYAFTDYKGIDWDAMVATFRPRFVEAEQNKDDTAYKRALHDFMSAIPDAHIVTPVVQEDAAKIVTSGLGMAIRRLDDGKFVVNYVTQGGPADKAGIKEGAEIVTMGGMPTAEFVDKVDPYSQYSFGTEHYKYLQQLRYATRAPEGTDVAVGYKNPGSSDVQNATLTSVPERESFLFSSLEKGVTGAELPVEFKILDNGLGYAKVNSFFDNEVLTVQLWEQMMKSLNQLGVPGVILDLRQNGGGSGTLADQMAAYFFNEELVLNNSAEYDQDLGKFYSDPNTMQKFIPPDPSLQYRGKVAVIVGPSCASACEFFTYDMTKQNRADIIGQYPTAGAGGGRVLFLMPGPTPLLIPVARQIDPEGKVIIEGTGVAPTIRVPVSEETLFAKGDPLLDTAEAVLQDKSLPYGAGPNTETGKPLPAGVGSKTPVTDTVDVTTTAEVTATDAVTPTENAGAKAGTASQPAGVEASPAVTATETVTK